MVRTIIWLKKADRKVREIFEYLESKAGTKTARRIAQKIYARPGILARNPLAGPHEESLEGRRFEYRHLVEGHYKIIYRITDEKIIITTVFDCRRDPALLGDETAK